MIDRIQKIAENYKGMPVEQQKTAIKASLMRWLDEPDEKAIDAAIDTFLAKGLEARIAKLEDQIKPKKQE